ncbi:hypothetical protein WG899_05460 [Paucibacter sp. AS339]|uniref:hypothetical protein n=1 Tax=Paucibacter hankyongi TaxID=3133434 RepID=UPI00309AD231
MDDVENFEFDQFIEEMTGSLNLRVNAIWRAITDLNKFRSIGPPDSFRVIQKQRILLG